MHRRVSVFVCWCVHIQRLQQFNTQSNYVFYVHLLSLQGIKAPKFQCHLIDINKMAGLPTFKVVLRMLCWVWAWSDMALSKCVYILSYK